GGGKRADTEEGARSSLTPTRERAVTDPLASPEGEGEGVVLAMVIDCHVHVSACTPENGEMSAALQNSVAFRFMRWRLKVKGYDGNAERQVAERLRDTLEQTKELDAAVILAFDGVYNREGELDPALTHLHVKNDYVIE